MQTEPPSPRRGLPQRPWAQFLYGLSYPWRALWFIRQQRLWRLAALPAVVHLLLFFAALILLTAYGVPAALAQLGRWQDSLTPAPEYAETLRVIWGLGRALLVVVLLPLAVLLAAVFVLACGQFLCGPWLDLLAERVEGIVLQRDPLPWTWRRAFDGFLAGLADLLLGPLYLAVVYLPFVLLSFLPIVGGLCATVAAALLVAHQCLNHTLSRAWLSHRARWQAVVSNRWLCAGFGLSTLLWLLPPLGLLTLPIATVGGTLLCCDLLREGRVRPAR